MSASDPDDSARLAIAALDASELATAVLHLDDALPPAGSRRLDRTEITLARPARIGFLDLEPRANRGHACHYLVIDAEDGSYGAILRHGARIHRSR